MFLHSSHCVDAASGIPVQDCRRASRLKGIPEPYLSNVTIAIVASSYFSSLTSSGASAVKTSPQRQHRSRPHWVRFAETGAAPRKRRWTTGDSSQSLPWQQSGQVSPW